MASRPPAAPAKAIPTPKAMRAVFSTLTPTIRPASLFCISARTAPPNQVLCRTSSKPPIEATAAPKTISRTAGKLIGPI